MVCRRVLAQTSPSSVDGDLVLELQPADPISEAAPRHPETARRTRHVAAGLAEDLRDHLASDDVTVGSALGRAQDGLARRPIGSVAGKQTLQIRLVEQVTAAGDDQSLEEIPEFPDVPRPGVQRERAFEGLTARGVPLGLDPPFEARPYPQLGQRPPSFRTSQRSICS